MKLWVKEFLQNLVDLDWSEHAKSSSYSTAIIDDRSVPMQSILRSSLAWLTSALEAKDQYTRNHSDRVAVLASNIAIQFVPGNQKFHETIHLAALLHDVGKIGMSEETLLHTGDLTPDMLIEIQKHPVIGESLLRLFITDQDILQTVRGHHERYDGGGYPDRLRGEAIPLGARIVAVADAYDAMVSARPYRAARTGLEAESILREGAGTQWDPRIVEVLQKVLPGIRVSP